MSRYSANPSYNHRITRIGSDDFMIYWTCDRYYDGSRRRFPCFGNRLTDRGGPSASRKSGA